MNKQYIIIIFLYMSAMSLCANQNQSSDQNIKHSLQPIVIEIYNDPIVKTRNENNSHHHSFIESNPIINTHSNLNKMIFDTLQDQQKKWQGSLTDILTWIHNNKIKSICIGGVSMYSYILYQIHRSNQIINDQSSWVNWKNFMTIDDLFVIAEKELERELIHAIQSRYVHPVNPTDSIYSMVQFSKTIQQEIELLHQQITLYQWIETIHASKLFFIDIADLIKLHDKYKKLNFIKHIFISWCATCKIEKL